MTKEEPVSDQYRVRVKFICRSGHEHMMCIPIDRGLPPELRCPPEQQQGFGGGGEGCPLPPDYEARIDYELGRNLQESKRRGFVLIEG
ncbi:hypothetical protein [Kribbella sp. CA-294648]|uniref:hypothetical protein n=1 Tax=Kribbella sp. CA-294648 TaxID=3239948 RepID=UPI003D93F216